MPARSGKGKTLRKLWESAAVLGIALVATQLAAAASTAANGDVLTFTSLRSGLAAVFVANADGSRAHRLTTAGAGAYQGDAAWSPDGSRVVFTCGNFELCIAAADGSGAARLTKSTWPARWSYDFEPAWSPDGTRIVFNGKRGGRSSALWLVNADGTGLRKLVDSPADDRFPEWSPDGLRIAYMRDADSGADLYIVNADGTGARRLTSGEAYEADPDWSPDGTTIAYERGAYASPLSEVWVMNAAGGGQRRLTAGEEPSWAPDGSFLLFSGPQSNDDELFSIRPDGSGRKRLTTSRGGDYTPQLRPAGVSVTLPQPPTTPPGSIHADARVVGAFIARYVQVIRDLSGFGTDDSLVAIIAAAKLSRDAEAGKAALASTRPVSTRGRRVRTEAVAGFAAARAAARTLLEIARLAPQGKKVESQIKVLQKRYEDQIDTMYRRLGTAYDATGL